jgi:23S rRNA pseudoU1915 N3-methylase RlmH
MVTDAGAKAKYEANAKAVDHLVRSLCDPEFERGRHLNLAWQIWEKMLVAHGGDNHVKARLFVSYHMQYENFTQLFDEDIDAMFQRFTAIVNNMKANVQDFPYTEHDQALKLLHILDQNIWGAKVEAMKESGQYLTIELDDLFSKLKSAEVDRKLQSKHEGTTDHSLALVGGSKGKSNTNRSCRQFSLSSLMSIPDEEFDVLGEEELAFLSRRFDRLHENRKNARRSSGTCYKCG